MKTLTIESGRQEKPSIIVSEKYKFISTETIVEKFAQYGWNPIVETELKVSQKSKTYEQRQGFQKHMVILEHEAFSKMLQNKTLNIMVRNSHDLSSSIEIFFGCLNHICGNQLLVREPGKGEIIRIRHYGNIDEKIQELLEVLPKRIESFTSLISDMENTKVTKTQIKDFLKDISSDDFGRKQLEDNNRIYNFKQLIQTERKEERKLTAWNIFNVVQEKMIRGGMEYSIPGKNGMLQKATRKIKSEKSKVDMNDWLFEKAKKHFLSKDTFNKIINQKSLN